MEKVKSRDKLPLLILPVYYTIFFYSNSTDWINGDATQLSKISTSSIRYSFQRYSQWSSRFWIEGATLFSTRHVWLFGLLSLCAVVLLTYSLSSLLAYENFRMNLVLSILIIATFPISCLNSAGWIATTVNYIWPMSLFAYWLSITIKYKGTRAKAIYRVIATLCLVLSIFSEILTLAAAGFLLLNALITKRKFLNWFNLISSFITVMGIINVLFCPGNLKRKSIEIKHWFPQYSSFSPVDRLIIQLNHLGGFITGTYGVVLICTIVLLLVVSIINKKIVASILLLLSISLQNICNNIMKLNMQKIAGEIMLKKFHKNDISGLYLSSFLILLSLILIALAVMVVYGKNATSLTMISSPTIFLLIALTSSDSPTLISSMDRPFIPFYLSLIVFSSLIVHALIETSPKEKEIIQTNAQLEYVVAGYCKA